MTTMYLYTPALVFYHVAHESRIFIESCGADGKETMISAYNWRFMYVCSYMTDTIRFWSSSAGTMSN